MEELLHKYHTETQFQRKERRKRLAALIKFLRAGVKDLPVKVFSVNDCDWIAARTSTLAILKYWHLTGIPPSEGCEKVCVVSDSEMNEACFHEEEGSVISFREKLERDIRAGSTFPRFFASTEY